MPLAHSVQSYQKAMGYKSNKEFRALLEQRKTWTPFWRTKKKFMDEEGLTAPDAMIAALRMVDPTFPGLVDYENSQGIARAQEAVKVQVHRQIDKKLERDAKEAEDDAKLSPADFEGRTCSERDAVMWAAEHLLFEMDSKDAPSKLAWGLYKAHRAGKIDIWKDHVPKFYPTRSQLDAERSKSTGNDRLLGLIEKAKREFREKFGREQQGAPAE